MRNEEVVSMWRGGRPAVSYSGALNTDGKGLYSYNVRIGYRAPSGATVVGDFTSPGGKYYSQTTSCHVGLACRSADHVMHPTVFENSEFKR